MTTPLDDGPCDDAPNAPLAEGPEEKKRLERLMEALLWMAWPERRPGFLGVPVELRGDLPDGRTARLVKRGDDWVLIVDGEAEEEVIHPDNAVTVMAEKRFLPSVVKTVPQIAPHVYLAAIIETEAAHGSWLQAARAVVDAVPEASRFFRDRSFMDALIMGTEPMPFVLATDAMDQCVRHAIAAIPLAIAAADAQVNTWANRVGGWSDEEQRRGWARRINLLAERHGQRINLDQEPFAALRSKMKLRNDLIHGNAVAIEEPLESKSAGRPLVLEARRTCLAVREALLALAAALSEEPPRYLAFCPEGAIEDDEVWRNARVTTGMREDSVFPKVSDQRD